MHAETLHNALTPGRTEGGAFGEVREQFNHGIG
jgi:hypothetical protein